MGQGSAAAAATPPSADAARAALVHQTRFWRVSVDADVRRLMRDVHAQLARIGEAQAQYVKVRGDVPRRIAFDLIRMLTEELSTKYVLLHQTQETMKMIAARLANAARHGNLVKARDMARAFDEHDPTLATIEKEIAELEDSMADSQAITRQFERVSHLGSAALRTDAAHFADLQADAGPTVDEEIELYAALTAGGAAEYEEAEAEAEEVGIPPVPSPSRAAPTTPVRSNARTRPSPMAHPSRSSPPPPPPLAPSPLALPATSVGQALDTVAAQLIGMMPEVPRDPPQRRVQPKKKTPVPRLPAT